VVESLRPRRRRRTSDVHFERHYSKSTQAPSFAPSDSGATKSLEFRCGRGVTVAGTPEPGAVVREAKELVRFARRHGYRVDELVRIIEEVG
jgi:hypothetical protein